MEKNLKRVLAVSTIPATIYYFQYNQIDFLKKNGYSFYLVTSKDNWISVSELKEKINCPVFTIPLSRNFSPFNDLISIIKLFFLIIKIKPHIVYYSTPKASFIASISAFLCFIPFRIYSHRGVVYTNKLQIKYYPLKIIDFVCCLLSHKIIVNSYSNLEFLKKNQILNKYKIGILGNGSSHGVDAINRFNPQKINSTKKYDLSINNRILYGFIGRIERDKGINDLIKSWALVNKEIKNSVLLIIGPIIKSWDAISHETLSSIKRNNTTILLDPVNDIENYYAAMDIFVFPSYREGFPNVVLEASAMEIPTITTDALGCRDSVVNLETGLIVPLGDIKKLADAMIKLGSDNLLRSNLGKKARQHVLKYYNPELINKELLFLFNNREFIKK